MSIAVTATVAGANGSVIPSAQIEKAGTKRQSIGWCLVVVKREFGCEAVPGPSANRSVGAWSRPGCFLPGCFLLAYGAGCVTAFI
jgi:hypothetical protein